MGAAQSQSPAVNSALARAHTNEVPPLSTISMGSSQAAPHLVAQQERRSIDFLPERKVEIPGNTAHGSVYHLKQLHWTPGSTPDLLQTSGASQLIIFHALSQLGVKDVFHEGQTRSVSASGRGYDSSNRLNLAEMVREVFPNGLPRDPGVLTSEQSKCLSIWSGAELYYALTSGVKLHATSSGIQEALILPATDLVGSLALRARISSIKVQADGTVSQPRPYETLEKIGNYIVYDLRESIALDHLQSFLRGGANRRAALIYGASHDFSAELCKLGDKKPLLVSLDCTLGKQIK